MNVRVETLGPCRRELFIQIPSEEVRDEFEKTTREYARHARIPGFRPGHAPQNLVRRRFHKEISDDVKQRLISRAYQSALSREKLAPVAVLDVRDGEMLETEPFSFSVIVDVAPDFVLPDYKRLRVVRRPISVQESQIDETLKLLREKQARFVEANDQPAEIGDLVLIDFDGVSEGRPIEELVPEAKGLGSGRDFWLLVDSAREFVPGFSQALCGATAGTKREIQVDFPPDYPETALAGRKAAYFVTVKGVRKRKIPPLDEEFVRAAGAASLEELRERVRRDLMEIFESNERRRIEDQITEQLLRGVDFELPESQVRGETEQLIYEIVNENRIRGVSDDEIRAHKDDILQGASRSAAEKIKLRYILKRIAEAENLFVSEEEVRSRIRAMAIRRGITESRLLTDLQERGLLEDLRDAILARKTLDRLVELAEVVTEAPVEEKKP
ncbi:MAG: trigger factor [Kiritimatiellae bacterium]|nr:trigger factor [Kiritimatiellia bacterium]MDW8458631.1 trigger factor [Verrucomicrobiota bacterium]